MPRDRLPPPEPMKLAPLAEIAHGGMGSVELARAVGGRFDGTPLAIKRLHANIASDPLFVGMFLDEAWMTAALEHPNVVQVATWGEDERGMFLAVELVRGVSLQRLLREARRNGEPFAERTVAFIGSQVCAALAAAHALRSAEGAPLGLVHRDLSPGNVLVSFDGIVKIADFGIAKAEERITHTRTGTLKGKPAYMAPEQARGGDVDARADLFSFGVVLFEMLAGRRPWTAKSAFDVMVEAATSPTPDLGALRPRVSPLFVAIVERCLAKHPNERIGSASEIRAELDGWRNARGFAEGDVDSLAQFVRRNSAEPIAWFEQALRGDFSPERWGDGGHAPTFREVDEPEARSPSPQEGPPRPAAGRAAPTSDRPDPARAASTQAAVHERPPGSVTATELMATRVAPNPSGKGHEPSDDAAFTLPVPTRRMTSSRPSVAALNAAEPVRPRSPRSRTFRWVVALTGVLAVAVVCLYAMRARLGPGRHRHGRAASGADAAESR